MGVEVVARMGPLTDSKHLCEERGKRSTMVDDKELDKKSRKALVACSGLVSEFENGARRCSRPVQLRFNQRLPGDLPFCQLPNLGLHVAGIHSDLGVDLHGLLEVGHGFLRPARGVQQVG